MNVYVMYKSTGQKMTRKSNVIICNRNYMKDLQDFLRFFIKVANVIVLWPTKSATIGKKNFDNVSIWIFDNIARQPDIPLEYKSTDT